ncbi:MAG: ATP-binding protein [Bacteroidales bacterium]|nr:ATP-binding protein [Bacteroidales bacterium]
MNQDNSFIQTRAMKNFLAASILTGVAMQISALTDGVIVSQALTKDALSAITIYTPIAALLGGIITMLSGGASMLAAKKLGEQDYKSVGSIFSVTLTSSVAVSALLVICLYFFLPDLTALLCNDDTLRSYLLDYSRTAIFSVVLIAATLTVNGFIGIDGWPKRVSRSMIITCISNILLDILLIAGLGMGIEGSAIATVLSTLLGLLVNVPHLCKPERSFHYNLDTRDIIPVIRNNLRVGVPMSAGNMVLALCFLFLNHTVLRQLGTEGAYVLSILLQMIMLSMMATSGFFHIFYSIGGVLLGEGDYVALKQVVNKSLKWVACALVVATALFNIFPEAIVRIFGSKEGMLIKESAGAVRVALNMVLPFQLSLLLTGVYMLVGRVELNLFFNITCVVALVAGITLSAHLVPDFTWHAVALSSWLLFFIQLGITFFISRKNRSVRPFTLLPRIPDLVATKIQVRYTEESAAGALNQINSFIGICETDASLANRISLCCEELLFNIINFGRTKGMGRKIGNPAVFELRLRELEDSIVISVKDAGVPFNPVVKIEKTAEEALRSGEDMHLGLLMVNGLCKDIKYKFMYGLNVTVMSFPKRLDRQQ